MNFNVLKTMKISRIYRFHFLMKHLLSYRHIKYIVLLGKSVNQSQFQRISRVFKDTSRILGGVSINKQLVVEGRLL